MAIDFDRVRELLKTAVRRSFDELRADKPNETFYAFAIYDAEGECPAPAANSEEHWWKRVQADKIEDSNERFYLRWATAEWAYEGLGGRHFDQATQPLYDGPKDDFIDFQARSFGASIQALKELSDEGYFGAGDSRVTVFFSITDDDSAIWLEHESAKRCNPPDVFAAFEREHRLSTSLKGDYPYDGGKVGKRFIELFGEA